MILGKHLVANVWFIDPRRLGRRPAYVVLVSGHLDNGDVLVTLDDDTYWGPWTASYGPDEQLETCPPHTPITQ